MKTIGYYLNLLPEPYRTKAINNTDPKRLETITNNSFNALSIAFVWQKSTEGFEYWSYVGEVLRKKKTP